MSRAAERIIDMYTKAGPGTLAGGAALPVRDVWEVCSELYALHLEHRELQEAYDELKGQHDGCM